MKPQYSRYYTYIKPILKNKIVKTYGSFVFSIITITILGVFALKPTLATIVSLQKSTSEQQQILNQVNEKVKMLSEGTKNYENLPGQTRTKLFNLIPDAPTLPKLIDITSSLASRYEASVSGIQFQSVELGTVTKELKKGAQLKEIELTLNLQGSYSQMTNFLKTLVLSDRLIVIKNVSFNKSADTPLFMTVNAKTYYVKN